MWNCSSFRWSLIAGRLPGRTDNEVKNYWNSHLRRKLISMGIDPNNHRLSHNFSRPHHSAHTVTSTPFSFGHKDHAIDDHRALQKSINCDQESDAASCLDNESSAGLPDLNLDLAITTPPPSPSNCVKKEEQTLELSQPKMSTDLEFGSSSPTSTLPLFR